MSNHIPVLGKLVPLSDLKQQSDLWHQNELNLESIFGNQISALDANDDEKALAAFMKPGANAFVMSKKFVMDLFQNHLRADYLIMLNACSLGNDGRQKGERVIALLGGEYEKTVGSEMHFKQIYSTTGEAPEHPAFTRVVIAPLTPEDNDKLILI